MKAAWLVLVLAGCGGAPFTAAVVIPNDGGDEGAPALTPDAGGADVLAREGGGTEDTGSDAACQPMTPIEENREYGCATEPSQKGTAPTTFAWSNDSACGYAPTPVACQCADTYDCACLQTQNVCATVSGSAWISCLEGPGFMPTVTCSVAD